MRVVFLTHNYPRAADDLAGAFLHPLAVALRDRGHQISVVAPSDRGAGGVSELDGIAVTRIRYAAPAREHYASSGRMTEALRSPAGWLAMWRMVARLGEAARTAALPGAVIHAHWWFPAGLAVPAGAPAVITLHGTDARLLDKPGAGWLARRALRSPRVVTAVSGAVAARAAQTLGRAVQTIAVQPMPLRLTDRRSRGGAGLIVIGRLTEQKRVAMAIRAHRLLRDQFPSLGLTIVGDGPARPALERLVAEQGTASATRFVGQVAPDQVTATIGDADVCLFPAEHEGLGLAAIEALATGVPVVVCRDGGGLLDIVGAPGTGAVVDPTAEALAVGASGLLEDPDRGAKAGLVGDRWRERLAPARVAGFFEERYREALRG